MTLSVIIKGTFDVKTRLEESWSQTPRNAKPVEDSVVLSPTVCTYSNRLTAMIPLQSLYDLLLLFNIVLEAEQIRFCALKL